MFTKKLKSIPEIKYFHENEIKKANPEILAGFQYSPSQFELSLISDLAYQPNEEVRIELQTARNQPKPQKVKPDHVKKPKSDIWFEIGVTECEESNYRGVAYFNKAYGQLVIAHKGTSGLKDMATDASLIFRKDSRQITAAYHFTATIIKEFGSKSTSITITGHSLGGCLAQITGFLFQYPKCAERIIRNTQGNDPKSLEAKVHVVAFDPPGTKKVVSEFYRKAYEQYEDPENILQNQLNGFDCTVYLCETKFVNVPVAEHIGYIYKMVDVRAHSLSTIIDFWRQGGSNKVKVVREWPDGFRKLIVTWFADKKYQKLSEPDNTRIKIAYFSKREIEFLELVISMGKYVRREKVSWESTLRESGKSLGINYQVLESFSFKNRRLTLAINPEICDLGTFINTIKFITYKNQTYDQFFLDTPALYEAVCQRYSEIYMENILIFNESTNLDIGDVGPIIQNSCDEVRNGSYQIKAKSKSPLVTISSIFHLFKQCKDKIYFIDAKNLKILAEKFQEEAQKFFSSGKFSVVIIQVNCDLRGVEYLFNQQKCIVKLLISNQDLKQSFTCSPIATFSDLTDECKEQVLNNSVLAPDVPVAITDILQDTDLENIDLNNYNDLLEPNNMIIGKKLLKIKKLKSYYINRKFFSNVLNSFDSKIMNNYNFLMLKRTDSQEISTEVELELLTLEEVKILRRIISTKNDESEDSRNFIKTRNKKDNSYFVKISNISTIFYEELRSKIMGLKTPTTLLAKFLIIKQVGDSYILHSSIDFSLRKSFSLRESPNVFNLEEDLHNNLHFGIRLIVGEPGIGKSTFFIKFIQLLRSKHKFVFHLNLNKQSQMISEFLKKSNNNITSIDSIINLFHFLDQKTKKKNQNIPETNPTYSLLMKQALENSVILMDGYDEISRERQENIKQIILVLKKFNPIIYIFARLLEKENLENEFGVISHKLIPLENIEQVTFLEKFWLNKLDQEFQDNRAPLKIDFKETKEILTTYSTKVLNNLLQNFKITEPVTGTPLQLFMLATVSYPNLLKKLNGEETEEFIFQSVYQLITAFIAEKYRIMLEEKRRLKRDFVEEEEYACNLFYGNFNEIHSAISFAYLFPKEYLNYKNLIQNEENIDELQKIGIIYKVYFEEENVKQVETIHRLILEYFCAEFIVSNLRKKDQKQIEFLKANYCRHSFDQIRLAMDFLLSSDSKVLESIILGKEESEIQVEILMAENSNSKDLLGRNCMHYFMAYREVEGDRGLTWTLSLPSAIGLFMSRDLMDVSPFNYLILNPRNIVVEKLLREADVNYLSAFVGTVFTNNSPIAVEHQSEFQNFSFIEELVLGTINLTFLSYRIISDHDLGSISKKIEVFRNLLIRQPKWMSLAEKFFDCMKERINQISDGDFKNTCENEVLEMRKAYIVLQQSLAINQIQIIDDLD